MSLYLKYRPQTLTEIRGNAEVVTALDGMLDDKETCPHSFLLTGPTGCGKTTIGRIIKDRLECGEHDFREVDSADFRGIDTVREIRKQCLLRPVAGPVRVWLIDECHKMTNDAQNALLKILEDTPKHVYFILCTTDPHKLLKTIQGRCSTFSVKPLTETEMFKLVKSVAKKEGHKVDEEIQQQIYQDSFGHPRNALQMLDQVLRVEPEQRLEMAKTTAAQQSESIELCRALIGKSGWKKVREILNGIKHEDPEGVRRLVMGYCSAILLKSENDKAAQILEEFLEPFYNTGFPGLVYACYSVTKN